MRQKGLGIEQGRSGIETEKERSGDTARAEGTENGRRKQKRPKVARSGIEA